MNVSLVPLFKCTAIFWQLFRGAFLLVPKKGELPTEGARRMRDWCQKSLDLLKVTIRVTGTIPEDSRVVMVVANHLSWMDPAVLGALRPARFIGKSEIARWPLVGDLARHSRSLFVDRNRPETLRSTRREIIAAFGNGDSIVLFAEGTTSEGKTVLPFRKALFKVPVEEGVAVVPVRMTYRTIDGRREERVAFTGDMTFISSLWKVARLDRIVVHVHFCPAIETNRETTDPGALANDCRSAILTALNRFDGVETEIGKQSWYPDNVNDSRRSEAQPFETPG